MITVDSRQWFELKGQYENPYPLPQELAECANLSLVRVYPSKKTQPGWGALEFVKNQMMGYFAPKRALRFWDRNHLPFGIVMRSIPYVVIDIDGKNGGIEMAQVLELPPTLAEISKSENGFHLFYTLPTALWDDERGYNELIDQIGLLPGIDIKGTGIVYHYGNQLWNNMQAVPLPESLSHLISRAGEAKRAARITREGVSSLSEDERVILHDQLKTDLESTTFTEGSRNNKLFAIGAKLASAYYPAWDLALYDRGAEIGLTSDEVSDIIKNIEKYT